MARYGKTSPTTTSPTTTSPTASVDQGRQGAAGNEAEALDPLYSLRFDALRSALYHGAREYWFGLLHRLAIAAGFVAGAAAVVSSLNYAPKLVVVVVGIFVSVLSILDLVLDWRGSATRHARLREDCYRLFSEAEVSSNLQRVEKLRARLALLYGSEPPVYHALNELMWNRAYETLSTNFDRNNCRQVKGWRKFFANVLPQRGHDFGEG